MLNLGEALRNAGVKEKFIDEDKIYFKDVDKLYPHPLNVKFYQEITNENITDLKQAILELGKVTEPLVVTKHTNDDKLYIVSGNRRREAVKSLYEEGLLKSKQVPYKLKIFENEEEEMRAIILLNTQRKKSFFEERNEYLYLYEFYKNEKKNKNIKGDTRDYVSERIGVSPAVLQRFLSLKKISKLIQEAINDKKIAYSIGIEFMGIDLSLQDNIFNRLENDDNLTIKNIRLIKKALKDGYTFDDLDENYLVKEKHMHIDQNDQNNDDSLIDGNIELVKNENTEEIEENSIIKDETSDIIKSTDATQPNKFIPNDIPIINEDDEEENEENDDSRHEIIENIENSEKVENIENKENVFLNYGIDFWLRQIDSILSVTQISKDDSDKDKQNKLSCIKAGKILIGKLKDEKNRNTNI